MSRSTFYLWRRAYQAQGDAQNNLGPMYAIGAGAPKDYLVAYDCLNLAGAQGDEQDSETKDQLRTHLNRNQSHGRMN